MKKNSGEIIIICALVGLVVGGAMLYIESGREAQARADMRGYPVHQNEVIAEDPAKSALTVFGPAIAGAGVGWVLQEVSDSGSKSSSRDNSLSVNLDEGNVNISIAGDTRQDNDTTTRSDSNIQSGDGWRVE